MRLLVVTFFSDVEEFGYLQINEYLRIFSGGVLNHEQTKNQIIHMPHFRNFPLRFPKSGYLSMLFFLQENGW